MLLNMLVEHHRKPQADAKIVLNPISHGQVHIDLPFLKENYSVHQIK
jgi:hypothetical protein